MKRVYILMATLCTLAGGLQANSLTQKISNGGKAVANTITTSAQWYWNHKKVTIPTTVVVAAAALYVAKKSGLCSKIKALKNNAQ